MFKRTTLLVFVIFALRLSASGQGPSPESAAPIFPGGGLLSFAAVRSTRAVTTTSPQISQPTLIRDLPVTFAWGMRRDFQLSAVVPFVTRRLGTVSHSGIGDISLLLKYRFWRSDSDRGTTQASFSIGPKLPIGRTDLVDSNEK